MGYRRVVLTTERGGETRMTFTLDGLGHITADEADRLLDELLDRMPDNGPVLDQDMAQDTLSITVAFGTRVGVG
jgi:dsDNA-binding SOS-regulon protein